MFCPRCSQHQTSDQLRFCSRCGFRMEAVKELVEHEEALATDGAQSQAMSLMPRQKEISIGAGLMFTGGIVAVLWSFVIGKGTMDVLLPQSFFILGFTLAFILLLFHPLISTLHKLFSNDEEQSKQLSRRQNGINLGAILMFILTLKAMLIATFMHPDSRMTATLLIMAGGFLLLLIIRWLVQMVYQMLFREGAGHEDAESSQGTSALTARLQGSSREAALPPAQSIPASFVSPRRDTAEALQPPSITEQTTELLDKQ